MKYNYTLSDKGEKLMEKISTLICMIVLCFISSNSIASEDDLRGRFKIYIEAYDNHEPEIAYSLLTPYSKEKINFPEYERSILEQDKTIRTDKIHVIRIKGDGKLALVVVRTEIKTSHGIDVSTYATTWKMIDGEWCRAYVEDNETTHVKDELDNTPVSDEILFELKEYSYYWDVDSSRLSNKTLYRPEIRLRVLNTGDQPIEHLQFLVQFIEKDKNSIFSSVDNYAVRSSDIPLKKGLLSETYFLKSSIGINIKDILQKSANSGSLSDIVINELKKISNNISPVLYYKTSYSSKWIEIESD